jgi:hypothetical protein
MRLFTVMRLFTNVLTTDMYPQQPIIAQVANEMIEQQSYANTNLEYNVQAPLRVRASNQSQQTHVQIG